MRAFCIGYKLFAPQIGLIDGEKAQAEYESNDNEEENNQNPE